MHGAYLGRADSLGWTLAKARGIKPINRDRAAVKKAEKALRKLWVKALAQAGRVIADQVHAARQEVGKDAAQILARIMAAIQLDGFADLFKDIVPVYEAIARDAVAQGFRQIAADASDEIVQQANDRAVAWARERAAELLGRRLDADGNLVDNGRWSVDETTRERVRALVAQAEENGWSNDRLADNIREAYVFSPERADVIARTETAFADVAGNMIAYRESGIVAGKRWILANHGDEKCCEDCEANVADGVIGLDDDFTTGDDAPPAHPNCRCDVIPVLAEENDDA